MELESTLLDVLEGRKTVRSTLLRRVSLGLLLPANRLRSTFLDLSGMSEHSEDAPPHEDSAEPTSPPPELSPSLGELDVELGIVEDSYNDTPEEPPTDTFPSYAQDDSPPPFAFPTAEEVAAQQRRSVEMVVADDADGFESVALGEREEQQEEEDLDEFSSIVLEEEEEEDTTPVATEAEEAEEGARSEHSSSTEPTATPSLSQSLSTTPPTTAPSSKVALPTSSETVSVAAAEEPQTPTVASKDVSKHVQAPSKGASVMQKVVSMTRQRDLPVGCSPRTLRFRAPF